MISYYFSTKRSTSPGCGLTFSTCEDCGQETLRFRLRRVYESLKWSQESKPAAQERDLNFNFGVKLPCRRFKSD